MTTFNTRRKTMEVISAREYMERRRRDPKLVEGARFLPAKLGDREFMRFIVKRTTPEYEVLVHER